MNVHDDSGTMGLFSRKKKEDEGPADVPEEQPVEQSKEGVQEEASTEKPTKSNGAYFVSSHPDGGWQVKKANAQKALKRFKTKAEAEAYAKQVAANQGTTVVRKKKDGKIQKKH